MGKNKNTPSAADLPALRIGSRLRCTTTASKAASPSPTPSR